jgi:flavin-dependent dehydrogenase
MRDAFDVVILGGGKAGNLLARQLRREVRDASVLVVERSRERSHKVGESTVDVCGKYLTKRLGLSTYLYESHLPKNGLRFFFDREDRSGALAELSEIGSTGLIPFPAFQIDRARLEEDLLRMNARDGIDVRVGARAASVRTGGAGEAHEIALEEDGVACGTVRARWLVDATGRASVLARSKGLRVPAPLENAAAWGRFRGVADIDDHGAEPFRARVRHTSRMLSTNHFCYPGYWIWLIPLGRGVTSVGVVIRRADLAEGALAAMRSEAGLLAFLRSHRAVAELIERAEPMDAMGFGQLAYGTSRYFDARERWALVGEAAAFTDPLYSPGGDFIALANDWVADLVRRDLGGEAASALGERGDVYDRSMALRYESTLLLYDGLYGTLGSFELFASKWDFDLACYLNLWAEPYFLDAHLDVGTLRRELDASHASLGIVRTLRHVFADAEQTLRREGRFFEKNLGHAVLDPAVRFLRPDFGTAESQRRAVPRVRDALQLVWDELQVKLGRPRAAEPIPFSRFAQGLPLT